MYSRNVHGDTFSMESKLFNSDNQLKDGAFGFPYQSNFNSAIQGLVDVSIKLFTNFRNFLLFSESEPNILFLLSVNFLMAMTHEFLHASNHKNSKKNFNLFWVKK